VSDNASPSPEAQPGRLRTPFFSQLRVRLLALVLLAILPALGLVLYTGQEQRRQARTEAEANAKRIVKLAAAGQKQHIETSRQILGTLAQLPQVRPERTEECSALFATLLQLHQVYANIGAIDAEGRLFASAMPPGEPHLAFSDQSYFQRARETGRFAVGEYQLGGLVERPTLTMAHPLREHGQFRGIVFASLDLKWLHQMAPRSDLPEFATLTLVDREGTILVRHQNPASNKDWIGFSVKTNAVFQRILKEGSELTGVARGLDGLKRLYASTSLSRSGGLPDAYVFVGIPVTSAYAAANRTMRQNSIFLGIVAVLALTAAWLASDLFVLRQVRSLVDAAQRLAHGDLKARSGDAGPGELGQLARSFDDMAVAMERHVGDLEKSRAETQALNEELEQRVLDRTMELRRSNEDLEQFAYVASHDLKEPLRIVKAYLELLQARHGAQLDAKAVEFVGLSLGGARRMEEFIDDLLAYSRVGRAGKAFESTDCNAAFERATANLQKAIEDTKAQITRDALPQVRGDITLLTQLFQNLISNALKFHGTVPPQVRVTVERKGLEWEFAVRDNGIGIAPQDFERVFVVFQRLHSRDAYPGTGIGLSVCKKIVERHGGRIWVESRLGHGTTFRFTLPLMEAGEAGE